MLTSLLQDGLSEINLSFEDSQIEQLKNYLELLVKWNKTYNLTAISDTHKMVAYHVLDSLVIMDQIPTEGLCLDVGTGAGLPGIPLAIMLPQSTWVLLDSNGKKTRFVQQAIASCSLSNVKVVKSRVEDYHADSAFDVIVSRAFSSVEDFVSSVGPFWGGNTRLITMKTELTKAELQSLDASLFQLQIKQLKVPGIVEKRSLVTIQRQEI